MVYHFPFSAVMCECSIFSTTLPTLVTVFFTFAVLVDENRHLIVIWLYFP
jgi:hypothetical protein